jgi:hypothetical protein
MNKNEWQFKEDYLCDACILEHNNGDIDND